MVNQTRLVDYLVAHDGVPPPPSGAAYDYVLAGDGLFVVAHNRHLRVRIPVAVGTVRGLPPLHAAIELRGGRLPHALWAGIVTALTARPQQEALVAVTVDGAGTSRLVRPAQLAGRRWLRYQPLADALLEVHSHGHAPARFSPTDDADEQGLRLYGVVGRLGSAAPQVALRAGAYGYVLPLPWDAVFTGDRRPFRDVLMDGGEHMEGDDACAE